MLKKSEHNRLTIQVSSIVLLLLATLCAMSVYAVAPDVAPQQNLVNVSSLSAATMLENITAQLPSLMRLVTAIAYDLGMALVIKGLFKLKEFGEQRTMMSSQHHLSGPLVMIVAGTLLLYLPSSIQVGLSTFWTAPNPYGYDAVGTAGMEDQWAQFINTCFTVVQLFGTIAFIRGLIILSQLGHGGGHQKNASHAIAHIIGGLFCINIYQLVQLVAVTIGLQT